jgi:hypothetical protein
MVSGTYVLLHYKAKYYVSILPICQDSRHSLFNTARESRKINCIFQDGDQTIKTQPYNKIF